jgi:hypothetical protein
VEFLDTYQAGLSFFSAYLLQIVSTHLLFAMLVYGVHTVDTPEKYFKTLWGQFRIYAASLVGSTILNTYLIGTGVDKTVSFFATMIVFACFNYFLVCWAVDRALESTTEGTHGAKQPPSSTTSSSLRNKATSAPLPTATSSTRPDRVVGWLTNRIQRGGALGMLVEVAASSSSYWGSGAQSVTTSNHPHRLFSSESNSENIRIHNLVTLMGASISIQEVNACGR